jgi:hypothetical protein
MEIFILKPLSCPAPRKARSSPASLPEAGRAEQGCRGAAKYLPRTLSKVGVYLNESPVF